MITDLMLTTTTVNLLIALKLIVVAFFANVFTNINFVKLNFVL